MSNQHKPRTPTLTIEVRGLPLDRAEAVGKAIGALLENPQVKRRYAGILGIEFISSPRYLLSEWYMNPQPEADLVGYLRIVGDSMSINDHLNDLTRLLRPLEMKIEDLKVNV